MKKDDFLFLTDGKNKKIRILKNSIEYYKDFSYDLHYNSMVSLKNKNLCISAVETVEKIDEMMFGGDPRQDPEIHSKHLKEEAARYGKYLDESGDP